AEEILDECPADRRRWEWYYLKRLCRAHLVSVKLADTVMLSAVFSSDGRRVAAMVCKGSGVKISDLVDLKIWDVMTGKELLNLGNLGNVFAGLPLAFSPDGKYFAAYAHPVRALSHITWPPPKDLDLGDQIVIWDANSGQALRTIKPVNFTAANGQCIAFSQDGRRILLIGWYGFEIASIWETATGQKLQSFVPAAGQKLSVGEVLAAFSPEGPRGAALRNLGGHNIWDTMDAATVGALVLAGVTNPNRDAAALDPSGRRLAVRTPGAITLLDSRT